MAISFLAPTATCSLVGASIADAKDYVWFGLVAASDTAACCAFYSGSTATMANHMWTLSVASGGGLHGTGLVGPFNIRASCYQGVYCQLTGTRASALVATASY